MNGKLLRWVSDPGQWLLTHACFKCVLCGSESGHSMQEEPACEMAGRTSRTSL